MRNDSEFEQWLLRRKKDVYTDIANSNVWASFSDHTCSDIEIEAKFFERLVRDLYDEKVILEVEKAELTKKLHECQLKIKSCQI